MNRCSIALCAVVFPVGALCSAAEAGGVPVTRYELDDGRILYGRIAAKDVSLCCIQHWNGSEFYEFETVAHNSIKTTRRLVFSGNIEAMSRHVAGKVGDDLVVFAGVAAESEEMPCLAMC